MNLDEVTERSEPLLPGPAQALGGLLGRPVPDLERDGLPLLWHWVYLLDHPAQADLGPDGHPVRGGVPAPPGPGRRRMWAGGRVRASGPLRCGEVAEKASRVLAVQDKQGRSGPLTFVTVGHQVRQRGQVVVNEEQHIVYRQAAPAAAAPAAAEPPEVPPHHTERALAVTATLLFRFSALTYNAHRIHYDRDYARDVEGYPGLLTHGPLQALVMAEAARARGYRGGLRFDYRLTAPLFDHQGLVAGVTRDDGSEAVTAVRDRYGRPTATGTIRKQDGPAGW